MELNLEEMSVKAKENERLRKEESLAYLQPLSDRYKARYSAISELMSKAAQREREKADEAALVKTDEIAAKARRECLRAYERETGHIVEEKSRAQEKAFRELLRGWTGRNADGGFPFDPAALHSGLGGLTYPPARKHTNTNEDCILGGNVLNKEKLKGIVKKFYEDYRRTIDEGDREYRETLRYGEVVTPQTRIYGAQRRNDFDETARHARAAAEEIFNEEFRTLERKKTEAPDADAAAVVSVMKGRANVSSDEVFGLLERYGDNYLVYHALADVASKNGIKGVDRHSIDEQQETLENLQHSINQSLTTSDAERGHGAGAFESVLDMMIDEY